MGLDAMRSLRNALLKMAFTVSSNVFRENLNFTDIKKTIRCLTQIQTIFGSEWMSVRFQGKEIGFAVKYCNIGC